MFAVFVALVLIVASWLAYLYKDIYWARKKCDWMPHAPAWPFIGGILEFGGHTRTIDDIGRLLNNPSKLCFLQIANHWHIMVKNYDLMEFVLSSNTILDKSSEYRYIANWLGTGLLTAPGYKWRQRRKIITPAFHFSILEQFVEIFEANATIMVSKLEREALDKESVDIYRYITAYALDTICETAMGVKIDTQDNKNQDYVFAVKDVSRITLTRAFSAWRGIDFLFQFSQDYKNQQKNLSILHGFTKSIIDKRRQLLNEIKPNNEDKEKDVFGRKRKMAFLDLLLNATTVDGQPLSMEDIREEVDTFMFEGHDTTASASSFAIYLLANHPEVQKLARDEQIEIFGKDKEKTVCYQDLQDMKYLELVLKETLRIYPSVPFVGRITNEELNYKGHIIPKGTILMLHLYGMNHDPDYFKDPEEFRPERFQDLSGKYPYSYIPFSAGPRNCIGQKFAMLEMKSIVSKVLRNFELYPTNPPHKLVLSAEAVLKSLNGVNIRLKKYNWAQN
ncbi:unnamed protein product [Ceutorhynchus assimilis]|uniref:Cytochrome P450 n=1 Tax=Ceutorhynchus assimilis TaxID=467358 RepID=A0A9N9MW90_9CUCU|nr:unnamed protein product [Ceutorhynchus assimilis]